MTLQSFEFHVFFSNVLEDWGAFEALANDVSMRWWSGKRKI